MQKILLVLGVVCLQVAFGGYITEVDLRASDKECLKELNLGANVILDNFHADWTITEGNEDINRISSCAFQKENYIKADGAIDLDKYKDYLINEFFVEAKLTIENPSEAASNALEACKSVQGSDLGDTLVKHYNCVVSQFTTVVDIL